MLDPGAPAPPFTLPDHESNPVALADLLARGPAVLFFYPGDFTPVCAAEACLFRDMHDLATRAGVQVAGINPGPPRLHAAFRATFRLPFRLLSDRGGVVARAYRAMGRFGLAPRRVTYVVAQDGTIADGVEASVSLSKHRALLDRILASGTDPAFSDQLNTPNIPGGHPIRSAPDARPGSSPPA